MRFDVLTLFPDMFREVLATSMPARAAANGVVEYHLHDLRDWTTDRHRTVDDRPFGGGPGMVMMCQPLYDAVHAVEASNDAARKMYGELGYEVVSTDGAPSKQICTIKKSLL